MELEQLQALGFRINLNIAQLQNQYNQILNEIARIELKKGPSQAESEVMKVEDFPEIAKEVEAPKEVEKVE